MNKVFKEALVRASTVAVADLCLSTALEMAEAKHGSIAEVNHHGRFNTLALSDPGWKDCEIAAENPASCLQDMEVRGLWKLALESANGLIVNDPANHPSRVGLPEGHPPLNSFLGIPIRHKRFFGLVGVANRAGGFSEDDRAALLDLAPVFAEVISSKQNEELVRLSRLRFESFFASSPVGLALYGPDLRYLRVNQAMARFHGIAPDEHIGKTLEEVIPNGAHIVEPLFRRILETGVSIIEKELSGEVPFRPGSPSHFLVSYFPVQNDQSEPGGLGAVVVDITDRKRALEELRLKDKVFEVSITANSTADANGIINNANQAFLSVWGYSDREQVVGRPISDFLESEEQANEIVEALQESGEWEGEYSAVRGDGSTFTAHGLATVITDDSGQIVGYQSAVLDVTDRKGQEASIRRLTEELEERVAERTAQLETRVREVERLNTAMINLADDLRTSGISQARAHDQLAFANRELEAFAYSVSHDLRAPLRHISGFVELMKEDSADVLSEKSFRFLKIIEESVLRMGRLIDDLLAFSRTGRVEMRPATVDLAELVQDISAELEAQEENRRIRWEIGALPEVRGDRSMLRQVFVNLLGNSVKFTRDCDYAHIVIGSQRVDEEITFFVRDNGVGFDPKYTDKLFGVFQRLHAEDEFEGTGIGLANVRRIIHRHGGRTWAEGEIGSGATFSFTLPFRM